MARTRVMPFSLTFSCPKGTGTLGPYRINSTKNVRHLTIYIEDENLGPMHISAYVKSGDVIQHIDQQDLHDLSGKNALRFSWKGNIPLSLVYDNLLYFDYVNRSGADINSVRFVIGVER